MFEVLHRLTTASLRDFAALCRQRPGTNPPSNNSLNQLVGTEQGLQLAECVRDLLDQGWRTEQVAVVADVLADERQNSNPSTLGYDLVLSGPEAVGVPTRDTAAVMHALLAEAVEEVLLVGYAIHNARQIFEPLARRMAHEPQLRVWCCLDIRRPFNDASLADGLVRRFAQDFVTHHWPWEPKPEVYYDPRSLEVPGTHRSSLHAKCVAIDQRAALITSANFTEAAQERNIECGVILRCAPLVERLHRYFRTLCESQQLRRCELPA
jgi:phosphatidylserine/phosphatidylglycerophosphate/cardiolipin synthase-like enzyme